MPQPKGVYHGRKYVHLYKSFVYKSNVSNTGYVIGDGLYRSKSPDDELCLSRYYGPITGESMYISKGFRR